MNPSLMLDVVRIKSGLTNCVHVVYLTKSDLISLKSLRYSVLTYMWTFDPITLSPTNRLSFYVCKDKEKALKLLRRIELLERNPTKKNVKRIIKIEGKLLGYPKCCVDRFSNLKVEGGSPEKEIIRECVESGLFLEILKGYPNPELPEEAYSIFTTNFYPCGIDCGRARKIGKSIVEYDERYGYKIVLSVLNLLPPVFEIYRLKPKTEFGRLIHDFVESLKDLKPKAYQIAKKMAENPLKFEVDYLNKVLSDMHD